jgi:hypothetical protein
LAVFCVVYIAASSRFSQRLPAQAVQYNRHAVEDDYE